MDALFQEIHGKLIESSIRIDVAWCCMSFPLAEIPPFIRNRATSRKYVGWNSSKTSVIDHTCSYIFLVDKHNICGNHSKKTSIKKQQQLSKRLWDPTGSLMEFISREKHWKHWRTLKIYNRKSAENMGVKTAKWFCSLCFLNIFCSQTPRGKNGHVTNWNDTCSSKSPVYMGLPENRVLLILLVDHHIHH